MIPRPFRRRPIPPGDPRDYLLCIKEVVDLGDELHHVVRTMPTADWARIWPPVPIDPVTGKEDYAILCDRFRDAIAWCKRWRDEHLRAVMLGEP